MKFLHLILIVSFFIAGSYTYASPAKAQNYSPMILGVPNFPPYSMQEKGVITGSAIWPASQALAATGVDFKIKFYDNYSVLLKALRKNKIQGFFLASKNSERDYVAEFSKPFTMNNWSWFTLKSSRWNVHTDDFRHNANIGTVAKTNTYRWLMRNGYNAHGYAADQLPSLLSQKKLDAVFAAEAVFENSAKKMSLSPSAYQTQVKEAKPFGMYISKTYLLKHPKFLKHLNKHIVTK